MQAMFRRGSRFWVVTSRRARLLLVASILVVVVLIVAAFALTLGVVSHWGWKTIIGWKALLHYIKPEDATDRKEALQVYAVIVAGVIASITAAVGLANLRLTRINLKQQRELEAERRQDAALQAYYEQIGKLLTEYDLLTTERKEVRELARGQTLAVLRELNGSRKGSLVAFLKGAGLIAIPTPAVDLAQADLGHATLQKADLEGANLEGAYLEGAYLQRADLSYANLEGAYLQRADLEGAYLMQANLESASLIYAKLQSAYLMQANLEGAFLNYASLEGAYLESANLEGADLSYANLKDTDLNNANLLDATMPDGSKQP